VAAPLMISGICMSPLKNGLIDHNGVLASPPM
jgi:hypothetical protein